MTKTWWERSADTRWGAYLTERERVALLRGLELAGHGGAALEIGCEGGRSSAFIAGHGFRLTCTDVDGEALASCAERLPDATCIQVSPSDRTLPCATGSLDLVLVYEVREVIEADWFPAEVARVLAPRGVLVCSYWNSSSLRGLAYRAVKRVAGGIERSRGVKRFQDYYQGPSYESFRRSLGRHCFHLLYEEGICWAPFPRRSNSSFVPIAIAAEQRLGLRKIVRFSPWVLSVAELRK